MPQLRHAAALTRLLSLVLAAALVGAVAWWTEMVPRPSARAEASSMSGGMRGYFVHNLGQWDHSTRFVHRSGAMTLVVQDRGWVLVGRGVSGRGVGLRMTFEGDAGVPEIRGDNRLSGHHNYFLGNDESRWRTGVPLFGSVLFESLYTGIDLRLREVDGRPEYELLLAPGADLSHVVVHVEGARSLSLTTDGALQIETEIGPLTQPRPRTWQVHPDGSKHDMPCNFELLGADRFGFSAAGWTGDTRLVIDPSLIWSTYVGGSRGDGVTALHVDARGIVTLAGTTISTDFPVTNGAYDTTSSSTSTSFVSDIVVTRLDPKKTGSAQLLYSTYFRGRYSDGVNALDVDAKGVVTLAGMTRSPDFPTTAGAFDTTHNAVDDTFVSQLDPSKVGRQQLVFSSLLGGSGEDITSAVSVSAGVVTIVGHTASADFPTTSGAFDTTFSGRRMGFVSRFDPRRTGSAQLVYSSFLGGNGWDYAQALAIDGGGALVIGGATSSTDFPTTAGAYHTTFSTNYTRADGFVVRLAPLPVLGKKQLAYSTLLGAKDAEVNSIAVEPGGNVTLSGWIYAAGFPTTGGAFDTSYNGDNDGFVSRLDPSKTGNAQLVYSTLLGGNDMDRVHGLSVDRGGVLTVAGFTASADFPTTNGAYDTVLSGQTSARNGFVSRLDPARVGSSQLIYSTFLGNGPDDYIRALSVDASGVATVAGVTNSTNFPTTSGAYTTTYVSPGDAFATRLSMGLAFYADVHEVSISSGGTQRLTVEAGQQHAGRSCWVFGSVTGTMPGVTLGSALGPVHIPLNPDIWTDYTIALANTVTLMNTKATLDASGTARAAINIPKTNLSSAIGLVFHHAYLVYDQNNNFYLASNPVPLRLVN